MKFFSRNILSLAIACTMLFTLQPLTANAETLYAENYEYDIVECANEVKEIFASQSVVSEADVDDEFLTNNYASTITYNQIIEHIYAYDDELRSHFAGACVNDEGYLVVMLSCTDNGCEMYVKQTFDNDDIVFSDGLGSYYEGQCELELINERIASLQNDVVNGRVKNDDIEELMALKPTASYVSDDNTVLVTFNMSDEVTQSIDEFHINDLSNSSLCRADVTSAAADALKQYTSAIELFKSKISDSETISFCASSDKVQVVEETEDWRPGRSIWVYNNPAESKGAILSTGYRAKYTYNGTTYYGFVTCAHGTNVGNSVYIKVSSSSTNKLGVILNRSYGKNLDVSFIRITNSNYTNSNVIYYTSSQPGVTRPGTILDGTQTTVSNGTRIYKSGQTTYLTYGNVSNSSLAYWYGDYYFYDLIQADRNMSDSGDSGSVTYVIGTSASSGKAVGILRGKCDGLTIFIKASNIKSVFGAEAY